jgi:hypothetical protein
MRGYEEGNEEVMERKVENCEIFGDGGCKELKKR